MPLSISLPVLAVGTAVPRWGTRAGKDAFLRDYDEDAVVLGFRAAASLLARTPDTPDSLVLGVFGAPVDGESNARTLAIALGLDEVPVEEFDGVSGAVAALSAAGRLLATGTASSVLVVLAHDEVDESGAPVSSGAVALLLQAGADVQLVVRFGADPVDSSPAVSFAAGTGRVVTSNPSFAKWRRGGRSWSYGDAGGIRSLFSPGAAGTSAVLHSNASASLAGAAEDIESLAAIDEAARGDRPPVLSTADFDPYYSAPQHWRDEAAELGLVGIQCGSCETPEFPATPSCPYHGPDAPLTPVPIARTGKVLTWTVDHVFPVGAPLGLAVVALDDGARFYGQVIPGARVGIDDRVELQLRRMPSGEGAPPRYFYKIAPLREG